MKSGGSEAYLPGSGKTEGSSDTGSGHGGFPLLMFFPPACLLLCSLFYVASSFFSATFETKKTMERPASCELVVDSGFFCRDENSGRTNTRLCVLLLSLGFLLAFVFLYALFLLYVLSFFCFSGFFFFCSLGFFSRSPFHPSPGFFLPFMAFSFLVFRPGLASDSFSPSFSFVETASKPLLQKPFLWKETKKAMADL